MSTRELDHRTHLRIAAELLAIAVAVTAVVTGVMYALAAPDFDDPYRGGERLAELRYGVRVLSALGAAAAGVLWLAWRQRARVDTQPDAAARFLASRCGHPARGTS